MKKPELGKFIMAFNSSITRKLVLSYLVIVIIPLTIGGFYALQSAQQNTREQYLSVVDNQLIQLDREMTEQIELCKKNAGLISQDVKMINILQNYSLTDFLLVNTINTDIAPKLNSMTGFNRSIHSMRILHGNHTLPDSYDCLYYQQDFNDGQWPGLPRSIAVQLPMKYKTFYITALDQEPVYLPSRNKPETEKVFAIYTPIYTVYLNGIVGIVETTIKQDIALKSVLDLKPGLFLNAFVLYKDGGVLCRANDFPLLALDQLDQVDNRQRMSVDGKDVFVMKRHVSSIDSWVVVYVDAGLLEPNVGYKISLVVILLAGLVTLGFIAWLLSRILTGKLRGLSKAMDKVKGGDLQVRVTVSSADEVGRLSENFNAMLGEINSLMARLDKASQAEREAIYKALENQVNPHFLGNALEMIRMTALMHDDHEVSDAVEMLANYFLYNIKRTGRYVSLKDELKNVSDYLSIYSMIKNRSIVHRIAVSEELSGRLSDFQVLRFILQPVVENSIKHGFRDKQDDCYLNISLSLDGGIIVIEIEDNGAGIPADRFERLLNHLDVEADETEFHTSGSGIGLRNVNERLILCYGKQFGISLESAEGVGTKVALRVPMPAASGEM